RRYCSALASESRAPAARNTGLSGIQNAPPDNAIEPPTYSVFSMMSVLSPSSSAASAAAIPAPAPMITRSTVVFDGLAEIAMLFLSTVRQPCLSSRSRAQRNSHSAEANPSHYPRGTFTRDLADVVWAEL